MEWREITTIEEWDGILEKSKERGQVIIKYSTTCPVSSNALKEFELYLDNTPNTNLDYTLVKVIESREVSNRIAEDVKLKHESPQVIMLKDGVRHWSATHWAVTKEQMKAVLD